MTRTRRIILLIVLAFVIYAVVTSPNQAAGYVQTVFQWLASAIQSIFQFFNALLH
jgi:cell shape-determining protein MreC